MNYVVEENGAVITKTKNSCFSKDKDEFFENVNPVSHARHVGRV